MDLECAPSTRCRVWSVPGRGHHDRRRPDQRVDVAVGGKWRDRSGSAASPISLTKYNFTHDLVIRSGVFVMHLLSNEPDMIDVPLAILMGLGGSSGATATR